MRLPLYGSCVSREIPHLLIFALFLCYVAQRCLVETSSFHLFLRNPITEQYLPVKAVCKLVLENSLQHRSQLESKCMSLTSRLACMTNQNNVLIDVKRHKT